MSSADRTRADLLIRLNHELRRSSAQGVLFSAAVASRLGINSSDLECLDILYLKGGASAGELAEATGLTTGAITGLIDRLEKAGFVRRERDEADRRKVMVRLLPTVESEISPLYDSLKATMEANLARYSDAEIAFLIEFHRSGHELMVQETAKLRTAPGAPTKAKKMGTSRG